MWRGGDRLWTMRWAQRTKDREQSAHRRPALNHADVNIGVAAGSVDWPTSIAIMSCRTRMAHVAVDGAAAVRAPASRHRSPDRHRVYGRSAGGSDRDSSPALADQVPGLRAKHGTAPALRDRKSTRLN